MALRHAQRVARHQAHHQAHHLSPQTRAKIAAAERGRHPSAQTRAKERMAQLGKRHPGEHHHGRHRASNPAYLPEPRHPDAPFLKERNA